MSLPLFTLTNLINVDRNIGISLFLNMAPPQKFIFAPGAPVRINTVNCKSLFLVHVIQEMEKPPPDPLHGLRIHSWVLVLEGKREVPESFFIEPFTGIAHPLTSENYLGIESLWNHQNYWVNMQDCSDGVKVQ